MSQKIKAAEKSKVKVGITVIFDSRKYFEEGECDPEFLYEEMGGRCRLFSEREKLKEALKECL